VHPIIRDDDGRLVPVVQPRRWQACTVKQSRERSERIAQARDARKRRLTTTRWLHDLDRRGIAALEASGIPWASVERWLDDLASREAFVARRIVTWTLQTMAYDATRKTSNQTSRLTPHAHSGPVSQLPSLYNRRGAHPHGRQ
jgi:hypothetical protein